MVVNIQRKVELVEFILIIRDATHARVMFTYRKYKVLINQAPAYIHISALFDVSSFDMVNLGITL